MPVFFGIDVGSSLIKGAVLDLGARELRHVHRAPMPEFVRGLPDSHREVDPAAVVDAVEDILAHLTRLAPGCDGVMFCGQMQGFVLVNGRGEAISNYISWLDRRVSPAEFEEMSGKLTPGERDELGNDLKPGIALPILDWLKRHDALPSGDATPVSLADFVAGRLSGAMPIMEPTQAAAFGALSLTTLDWHRGAIGKLGLESLRWPEVRPTGSTAGAWQGAPCFAAVGDQQCALAGASLGERELSVNIGTGSQVSMITESARPEGLQVRPYFGGRFLRTITHIPGGRALGPLIRLLTEIGGASEEEAWRHIERALASVPATDLRASVAFFPGPCGYGGFFENLHDGNLTIGHVFRAVFESMARNYEACARRIDPDGGAVRVVFSGGVARRIPLLRELTAAAMGLPQRLSPHPEDTLLGLLMLACATMKL
jgi:sugar (pentulose or hexulose) kinase